MTTMTTQSPLLKTSTLSDLWNKRKKDFPYWHGYSVEQGSSPQLTLLVEPGQDHNALLEAASALPGGFRPTLEIKKRFQMHFGAKSAQSAKALSANAQPANAQPANAQPANALSAKLTLGAAIFARSQACGKGCPGTIGAFLRKQGTRSPVWALTNHHILVKKNVCLSGVQVFTPENDLISNAITPLPLQRTGNKADIALAELLDPQRAGHGELTAPQPILPLTKGSIVQKHGAATGITEGTVLSVDQRVEVLDCEKKNSFEFVGQVMIGSIAGKSPFLDGGDSGSLVVSNGQPAAILFAIDDPNARSPTGIATPFQMVLSELEGILTAPLEMML